MNALSSFGTCLLVVCLTVTFKANTCSATDVSDKVKDVIPEQHAETSTGEERRATWLETRNLEENFKELVYLSIQELISEGRLSPQISAGETATAEKRGRHQGFCFRKTKSGRFLPYICWKGEGDQEE
jgi:hypothetical protein